MYNSELPTTAQLAEFTKKERGYREIFDDSFECDQGSSTKMSSDGFYSYRGFFLRCGRSSYLGCLPATNMDKAMMLLAKIPTMVAADYRFKKGLDFIPPKADLSISENFFHMCFGKVPQKEVVKAF